MTNSLLFQSYLETVLELLEEILVPVTEMQFSNDLEVTNKGQNDVLTKADIFVDRFLIQRLGGVFPEIPLLTEESVESWRVEKKDFSNFATEAKYWVIDSIDGTANYAAGSPNYAISVGLVENNQVVLGVIARPAFGEIYYSTRDLEESFLLKNGQRKKLQVSKTRKLIESRMALEPTGRQTLRPIFLPIVEKLIQRVGDPRNLGSSVTHACLLAKGEIDAMQSPGYPWDMVAGSIIVQNAGGRTCQLNGETWGPLSPNGLFCCNAEIEAEVVGILGEKRR